MRRSAGTTTKLRRKKKVFRKKVCKFCVDKVNNIDYKEYQRLGRFLTEKGKIISRKINGNCNKHQRYLTQAVKRARQIALLPYTV